MADDMTLQLKEARLGTAPPGSVITFRITGDKGFSANALLEADMKVVATWESVEIAGGQLIEEKLVPKGIYTLQVSIAYRSTDPVDVTIDFSIAGLHSLAGDVLPTAGAVPVPGQ
jgi:hypothetical protein